MSKNGSLFDSTVAVVLDNGSHTVKAGMAGDLHPKAIVPTVALKSQDETSNGSSSKGAIIGHEARNADPDLQVFPVMDQRVTDWDCMERLWMHVFSQELHVQSNEHPVLYAEPHFNVKSTREITAQILFEKFLVPGLYFSSHSLLALYSTGKTSGVVFDSGYSASHIVPIVDGSVQTQSIQRIAHGGKHVDQYLKKLLANKGCKVGSSAVETEKIVSKMKEKLAFVAVDFEQELDSSKQQAASDKEFELPDGTTVTLGSERFQCAETIFSPHLRGYDVCGASESIYQSISNCNYYIRDDLYGNVVLSGGNTCYAGMGARMQKELSCLAPSNLKVHVEAADTRKHAVWIGGSHLASLSNMKSMWVAKAEYDEAGPSIVNRKCF
jgi:actin-related protein